MIDALLNGFLWIAWIVLIGLGLGYWRRRVR